MSGIFNTVQHNKCQKVKKIKGKSVICKARALTSSEFQRIVLGVFFWVFFECYLWGALKPAVLKSSYFEV